MFPSQKQTQQNFRVERRYLDLTERRPVGSASFPRDQPVAALPVRTFLEIAVKSHEKYPVVIDAEGSRGGNAIASFYIGVRRGSIKKIKFLWGSTFKSVTPGQVGFQKDPDRVAIWVAQDDSFDMTQHANLFTNKLFA